MEVTVNMTEDKDAPRRRSFLGFKYWKSIFWFMKMDISKSCLHHRRFEIDCGSLCYKSDGLAIFYEGSIQRFRLYNYVFRLIFPLKLLVFVFSGSIRFFILSCSRYNLWVSFWFSQCSSYSWDLASLCWRDVDDRDFLFRIGKCKKINNIGEVGWILGRGCSLNL